MNINDMFPSNYLKAADLKGQEPTVTISHIKQEQLGDDNKVVLYFQGKEKGVVLNKTNATNIASMYGPETGDWIGKRVKLVVAWVDFQGRSVEAIRIRPPEASNGAAPAKPVPHALPHDGVADLDDAVPF